MPLDPPIKGVLALLESMHRPALAVGNVEEARRGFRRLTVDMRRPDTIVPVEAVEDILARPDAWRVRGLARAAGFSWEKTARAHDAVYAAAVA